MKLLILSLLIISNIALADGSLVGSYANYKIQSGSLNGKVKVSITSYDSANDTYEQVSETTASDGQVFTDTEILPAADLNTPEENEMLLMLCESDLGGTLKKIKVAAGEFRTCLLEDDGLSLYLAKVPFGYIKIDSIDEKIELLGFSY